MHGKEKMTQKNRNSKVEDFERYLADEMSAAEKNAFEKEMQKNDFEAEALEGFEAIQTDISGDLKELHNKINTGKPKRKLHYWAAAATILLLISSGIIWMQLSEQNPIQQTADTKIETEEKNLNKIEEPKDSYFEKEPATKSKENTEKTIVEKNQAEPVSIKKSTDTPIIHSVVQVAEDSESLDEQLIQAAPQQVKAQKARIAAIPKEAVPLQKSAKSEDLAQNEIAKVISGQVISAENKTPIPGASIIEKGTLNGVVTDIDGNFSIQLENDSNTTLVAQFIGMEQKEIKPSVDSNNFIELINDNIALNEIVIIGFEPQRKKQLVGSVSVVKKINNAETTPICGQKEYDILLSEKAILPNNYSTKKVVVKLLLSIDQDGTILKIENTNKADEKLVKHAKEIIREAPKWNAKIVDGINVASDTKLKIVFTKK